MPSDFDKRCREIARKFLVSAVVVDDKPYYSAAEQPESVQDPGRDNRPNNQASPPGRRGGQSLDAGAITESFSKLGLICGVVKPTGDGDVDVAAVERADLVVIDWRLDDEGERAMKLINSILDGDQGQRLRLIAVYTGESDIVGIGEQINKNLHNNGYRFEGVPRDDAVTLSCGHCRIEIYAKQGTPLAPELEMRSVRYADMAGRLIEDFARMTTGLMPSIALVALTAVRENAHRVLDKFDGRLDAAFLTHRACLDVPDDSEQHMVAQIASELRAIMEEEVGRKRPAGMEAIKSWIKGFKSSGIKFAGNTNHVSQQAVIDMLDKGLAVSKPDSLSGSRAHSLLTAGFSHDDEDGDPHDLDLRLAWMMCFRAFDPPDKKLWLGTAVRRCGYSDCEELLLCMRPRCDSVRMTEKGSFLFLPLVDPRQKTFQLVVRSSSNGPEYCQVTVDTDMSRWKMIKFEPDPTAKAVVARKNGSAGYVFTDVGCNRYEWIGELKAEVAHSIGQALASKLSRIALDKSEWLRRSER